MTSDGEYVTIEAVRPIHYKTPQTTYNFEVADFHTYYVSIGVLCIMRGVTLMKMEFMKMLLIMGKSLTEEKARVL